MKTITKKLYDSAQHGDNIIDVIFSKHSDDFLDNQKGRITFRKTAEGIYGTLHSVIDKIDGHLLQETTVELYREMFEFISEYPGYQFIRIWNYVPFILTNMDQSAPDIEVYRCFNAGRYKAFQERYGEDMENWPIPAASAVGALDNILAIEFFASDATSYFFENKVQIPAYHYSSKYGKLPPVFSRGAICKLKNETLLFISGTASVVNEDSVYIDDTYGQTQQTFQNISGLISNSNLKLYDLDYEFKEEDLVFLRVYYKNKSDEETIKSEINRIVTTDCQISYVNTNICRENLIIEIEGIGRKKIM